MKSKEKKKGGNGRQRHEQKKSKESENEMFILQRHCRRSELCTASFFFSYFLFFVFLQKELELPMRAH